jgi:U3 small nucleolar RNA-associated protein 4
MDIHRCRFVPYNPAAINAIAFSPTCNSQQVPLRLEHIRLAVGRSNGDIEIWHPLGGVWLQESIFRGGKDRSIEGLAWTIERDIDSEGSSTNRLRLFSIGYSSEVTEWDLSSGTPLRHVSTNSGEIWCIAAQNPEQRDSRGADSYKYNGELAVGCSDGTIAIISTENDELNLSRSLVRSSKRKARVLSIDYHGSQFIVAGFSDGTIKVCDIKSRQTIRTMSLGGTGSKGPSEVLVWAVKSLKSGSLASVDSTGELKIWDGETFTLSQRLKAHKGDALCLVASSNGGILMSGGMDRKTVIYRLSDGVGSSTHGRWAVSAHRKFHTHDLKAMAVFDTMDMSIVVSGG